MSRKHPEVVSWHSPKRQRCPAFFSGEIRPEPTATTLGGVRTPQIRVASRPEKAGSADTSAEREHSRMLHCGASSGGTVDGIVARQRHVDPKMMQLNGKRGQAVGWPD